MRVINGYNIGQEIGTNFAKQMLKE